MRIPATKNEFYGFYGTIALHLDARATERAWKTAAKRLAEYAPNIDAVRFWLDSRNGRHFADTVIDNLSKKNITAAIDAAIARWRGWKLDSRTAKDHGMPDFFIGGPLLDGELALAGVLAEDEA